MFDHSTTACNTPVFSIQEVPSSGQQANIPIPIIPLDLTTNDKLTPPANETQVQAQRSMVGSASIFVDLDAQMLSLNPETSCDSES
jgi:hypothetical protein